MENVSLLYSCFLCVVLCHGKSISHSPQGISYNGHLASGFSKISMKPPNRMVHELYELRTFKVVVVDNIVFDHSSCFPPSFKNDAGVVCRQNEPAVIVWSYLCVCVCVQGTICVFSNNFKVLLFCRMGMTTAPKSTPPQQDLKKRTQNMPLCFQVDEGRRDAIMTVACSIYN